MPTEKLRVIINRREFLYVSNILSLLRILLLPAIILSLRKTSVSYKTLALALMVAAMLTDGLDGYLARRLKEVSALGKILDPVGDKVCIGVVAIAVTIMRDFPWWAMGFIILRDIGIVVGGVLMVERWAVITSSNIWGKATSFFQAISVVAYALELPLRTYPLTVALVFTGVSAISYVMEFFNLAKEEEPG